MDKTVAKALRSDTKADLLSSAPPPVMAEALQLNEETVTSGRQLIARPASTASGPAHLRAVLAGRHPAGLHAPDRGAALRRSLLL